MKDKVIKMLLIFLLASVAVNLSLSGASDAVVHPEIEKNRTSCFPGHGYNPPDISFSTVSAVGPSKSNLLGYLFQIMFILFFISPPLIVVLLFLIWQELKERNKMK
jgi:hypothetical protein